MIQFQDNIWTNGRTEGWADLHRILPTTARGLRSTTAVVWHLKVKEIEYDIVLTKIIASKSACTTKKQKKQTQFIHLFLRYYRF